MPGPRRWLPGVAIAFSAVANAFLIYAVHRVLDREPPSPPIEPDDLGGGDDEIRDPYSVRLVQPEELVLLTGVELVSLPAPTTAAPSGGMPVPVRTAANMAIGAGRRDGARRLDLGAVKGQDDRGPIIGSNLGMRGRRHDLGLSGEAMRRILGDSYEMPEAVEPTGKIRPKGARAGVIDDAVATVKVHPDGTVDMKSKPHATIHIGPPIPTMEDLRAFGENIATWYADPYKMYREVGRSQDLPRHITAVPGACETWGEPGCESATSDGSAPRGRLQQAGERGGLPLMWGKLDITGWLMEKTVGDAYASRKLKLLDSTREERIAAGAVYRAQRAARSAEYVQKNLESLWSATTDAAARRAALFTLWDECTEDDNGKRARAMVLGWIRAHFPSGSPNAFTSDEIAKLDANRSSTEHFAPY